MFQGRVHVSLLCAVVLASCSSGSVTPDGPAAGDNGVKIVPSAVQLQPGQKVTFSAGVTGTDDARLVWRVAEVDGGSIAIEATAPVATAPAGTNMLQIADKPKGQGTYTAPGKTGKYHVVAASSTNQTATDVAIVTVTSDPTATATPDPAPTLSSFDIGHSSIVAGQSTTLTWSVSGATSVRIDPGIGDVTGSSSTVVTPSSTTTYTLTASGSGLVSATTTVTVTPPPRTATQVGAEFFVATTGSDSNPGTISAPFATLERAQTAVRGLKNAGLPASGVAVTLRGGVYARSSPLLLTSADSGTAGSPVIWRSYPGETVRITGGREVGGWTTVTSGDSNWSRVRTGATLYRASIGLAGSALMSNFMDSTSWTSTAAGDPDMGGVGISSSAVPFQGD